MFVSLAVDVGVIHVAKGELQAGVDSAARQAARGAMDGTAITRAITAAAENSVNGAALVLLSSDVELGRWNVNTRTFIAAVLSGGSWTMPDNTKINAVRITGRLDTSRNTGIKTLFAAILSPNRTNISATVIATGGPSGMPPSSLHRFNESSGSTCADDAPNPAVQSAYIADSSKTSWTGGGLRFNSATKAVTAVAATNVTDNLSSTNKFTVFGRILPSNFTQTNASIVSLASNASNRNFTLRQQAGKLEFLMTTSSGGITTSTSLQTATFMTGGSYVHYDFCATFDGSTLKLYARPNTSSGVSGVGNMVSTSVSGSIANWDRTYRLVYGNEDSNDRPYIGEILHVGIYDAALNTSQISELFGTPDGIIFYPTASSASGAGGSVITVK